MRSLNSLLLTALCMFSLSSTCLAESAAINSSQMGKASASTRDIRIKRPILIDPEIQRCDDVQNLASELCQGAGGPYSCGIQADSCNKYLCMVGIAQALGCANIAEHYQHSIDVLAKAGQCSACA